MTDTNDPALESRCSNCDAVFATRYCGACGQAAQTEDRVFDLAWEWVITNYAPDGLLFKTLKRLIIVPAALTRDWWKHRRAGQMSPIRTLLTMVFLGSALAWAQTLIKGDAHSAVGLIISAFTYQLAIVSSFVAIKLLPMLFPERLRRTDYEYATFAMYESAFLVLVAWSVLVALVLSDAMSWLGFLSPGPAALPLITLGVSIHATWHMKELFRLSWSGAIVRTVVLSVAIAILSTVVSFILMTTGISELWNPAADFADEPLPSFQRVPTGS